MGPSLAHKGIGFGFENLSSRRVPPRTFVVRVFRGNWAYFSLANFGFLQRHFGWGGDIVRRGRPGLAGSAPSGLVAVGVPAANSLSRIFVRVGNGLNGPTFTIPDSMPGSLDCAARELQSPGYSVDTVTNATMPQAVDGLRNSSTTVMRRMLASIKSVEEVLGGGLLLIRHWSVTSFSDRGLSDGGGYALVGVGVSW